MIWGEERSGEWTVSSDGVQEKGANNTTPSEIANWSMLFGINEQVGRKIS